MSPPCWLLPHADPVGPWLRARSLVAHLPGNRLPLLIFRAEPSPAVRGELGDLGISYLSLGKKGLNALAAAWKLRALLRAYRAPRVHVWDLADLPIAVVAVPSDTRVFCEIAEGQVPPRFFLLVEKRPGSRPSMVPPWRGAMVGPPKSPRGFCLGRGAIHGPPETN